MKTILCFGNPHVENDSLAILVAKELNVPGVEFKICENLNELLNYKDDEILILDVVDGIKDITVITDIDLLKENKLYSLHDFDLGFFLKLMKEMKKIKKIRVIGIPIDFDLEKTKKNLEKIKSFI